jgi:hypothetical protein
VPRARIKALVRVSCLHGRQLLHLHSVGNRSPTHVGGGARTVRPGPMDQSEPDLSCEAETSRVRWRLVV